MSAEQSVGLVAGKTEVLGENLPQCRYVHHKFHMNWPRAQIRITAVEFSVKQVTIISMYVSIQFVLNLCHLIAFCTR
jgi:hypothetical protein